MSMTTPVFDFPDSPHTAGNRYDDDGEQIDNLVEQAAEPPTPKELPIVPADPEKVLIVLPNRLLTGRIVLDKTWAVATMILPADLHRKSITFNRSGNASIAIASAVDNCTDANGFVLFATNADTFTLTDYTGPIYVRCTADSPDATAALSWAAVTK